MKAKVSGLTVSEPGRNVADVVGHVVILLPLFLTFAFVGFLDFTGFPRKALFPVGTMLYVGSLGSIFVLWALVYTLYACGKSKFTLHIVGQDTEGSRYLSVTLDSKADRWQAINMAVATILNDMKSFFFAVLVLLSFVIVPAALAFTEYQLSFVEVHPFVIGLVNILLFFFPLVFMYFVLDKVAQRLGKRAMEYFNLRAHQLYLARLKEVKAEEVLSRL